MRIVQPYDGKLIAEIPVHTAADIESKLQAAVDVFSNRANWLPAHRRIEILKRLARLVEEDRDALALLIAREGGKPLTDAKVEVTRAISGIEGAAAHIEHLAGSEIPMGLTAASSNRWAFTTREPIGPVVAISAFNHPLNLVVHQVVPAIATGCPVLIKPAPVTPLTCLRFDALVHKAGLPESWCQAVILDDNALAQSLATDRGLRSSASLDRLRWGGTYARNLPPVRASRLNTAAPRPCSSIGPPISTASSNLSQKEVIITQARSVFRCNASSFIMISRQRSSRSFRSVFRAWLWTTLC